MTIKGIICDFGGVLVLNHEQPAHQKWIKKLNMDYRTIMDTVFGSEAAAQASVGLISEDAFWKVIQKQFSLSDQEGIDFSRDIFAEERINSELIDLISLLPKSFKKAVLSNAFSGARQAFTKIFHLDEIFNLIVISAEEGIAKPDDEIYLRTADRLELNPWELLFIDDMLANAQAAAKVGMAAIHFNDVASTNREIKTLLRSQGVIISGVSLDALC
jgi:epoxide hydrolase-like predicted phosphatase